MASWSHKCTIFFRSYPDSKAPQFLCAYCHRNMIVIKCFVTQVLRLSPSLSHKIRCKKFQACTCKT